MRMPEVASVAVVEGSGRQCAADGRCGETGADVAVSSVAAVAAPLRRVLSPPPPWPHHASSRVVVVEERTRFLRRTFGRVVTRRLLSTAQVRDPDSGQQ
ncbi:hypothetical protein MTP99_008996 [Tenebrio molitor]|nr:hypothetical protein MTP99_008996 [Tenebrio molitor]